MVFFRDEAKDGLTDINSQIFAIADTCCNLDHLRKWFRRPREQRELPPAANLSQDYTAKMVGEDLLAVAPQLYGVDDKTAVQLSMQAVMCCLVYKMSYNYPYLPTVENNMWDMYRNIHDNGIVNTEQLMHIERLC